MTSPRVITAAQRAERRAQRAMASGQPVKAVAWHKKMPDGTRCPTCSPIIVPVRSIKPSFPVPTKGKGMP